VGTGSDANTNSDAVTCPICHCDRDECPHGDSDGASYANATAVGDAGCDCDTNSDDHTKSDCNGNSNGRAPGGAAWRSSGANGRYVVGCGL